MKVLEAKRAAQKVKKEKLVFERPAGGWRSALTELIGAEEANKVESVAKCQADGCFLLSPEEFQDRVYLQVCIQNCFPGLDCKMQNASTPEDQGGVQQIHVLLDPVYKKFRDGGMALENCDRLLTFLRKGAGDGAASKGLELEHEDTKEARTALHRLISKHSSCFKTKTETRNGVQRLVVHFLPKSNKKRKRSQPQVYLQFTLQKEGDSEDAARAKQMYLELNDVEAAMKLMPLGLSVERQILQGLKRYGCDAFEQAVKNVPFSRRVMYMHSYQSYLFNRMASFRLRHYGAKVVAGDLIQCDGQSESACPVKIVTVEEAETLNNERKDALALVLLPLPGTKVMLPSNATKAACLKLMEDGGTKNALCESGPVKGAYRSLVSFPHDLEWVWEEDQDKAALSLQLSFSLDSGCFATMCLREVLRSDI
ncbi:hypothetical protein BBO99_00001409 [Phytophthora kernoviae]|uniref:TRUD domain-containing protein n=2 Tax=Phytophthora kernoviae TaxID=325452 RepID=A0A3R7JW86_9STRA|nr:hypothetical protein G195_002173 [Phytophthora kernoviae 00238/432]KAG2530593.1 hypothetical protein JM16_000897 [Phytophthora kernoviae]KAG2531323.1 hypothetical protein JM18_001676 [Phytophthora kernoviae]RLN26173.1 hypothetical protein BBI17_001278 [Phytophthora kernoviae]RLN84362.1 hypothetical protein BBO99_00001409 [Phytophthora kernoviae]